MRSLSPRARQILLAVTATVLIVAIASAGALLGRNLTQRRAPTPAIVVAAAPTVASAAPAATSATAQQAKGAAQRVAVPDGRVENETGIAILPAIQLQGSRRYVLQVSSRAGALAFSSSYSRSSIEPKIAIDPITEIKGTTPWEQEVQPPAADSRQWTLGVSLSASPIGKNIQVQVWDIGPK